MECAPMEWAISLPINTHRTELRSLHQYEHHTSYNSYYRTANTVKWATLAHLLCVLNINIGLYSLIYGVCTHEMGSLLSDNHSLPSKRIYTNMSVIVLLASSCRRFFNMRKCTFRLHLRRMTKATWCIWCRVQNNWRGKIRVPSCFDSARIGCGNFPVYFHVDLMNINK